VVALCARLERDAFATLLGSFPRVRVLGTAGTFAEAFSSCAALQPHVLLLDTLLQGESDLPATAVLRLGAPRTRIVALAPHAADRCALLNPVRQPGSNGIAALDDGHVVCTAVALANGAHAAVRREASGAELLRAIRAAARRPASATSDPPPPKTPASPLTPQEGRVARRVGEGESNKEIAAELGISPLTVKKHVAHALRKLGLHDRLQLGVCVARHPLVFGKD